MAPCSSFSSCFQSRRPVPRPPWPLRWIYTQNCRPRLDPKRRAAVEGHASSPVSRSARKKRVCSILLFEKRTNTLKPVKTLQQRHRSLFKMFQFPPCKLPLGALTPAWRWCRKPDPPVAGGVDLARDKQENRNRTWNQKITEAKSSLSPTSWREYDSRRNRTIFAGSNLKVQIRRVASSNCCTACRGENELHPPKETHPSIQQFHSFKEMIWTKHEHMVIHLIWRNATHQKFPEVFVMSCPRLQKAIPLMISIVWEPPFTTVGLEAPLEKLHGCREPGGTQLRAPIIHSIQGEGK